MLLSKVWMLSLVPAFITSATFLAACGGDDDNLTREDVVEIVRSESDALDSTPAEPGITESQVQEIVQAALDNSTDMSPGMTSPEIVQIVEQALADAPEPAPAFTSAEIREIVQQALADVPEPDPGLTQSDVKAIIQAALATVSLPEPSLTRSDVEETIQAALREMADSEPGLTADEVRRIARDTVASIPLKSAPADYTKFFVQNAISRYETDGLEDTLSYYSRLESVDQEWYVFIIGSDGKVVAHYDSRLIGEDLSGPIGTDANGYNFGPEMLSATEDGKWVTYVYHRNPEHDETGFELDELELKNVWVVRHDGLLFASGWYIDAEEFTRQLVTVAVDTFRAGGLAGTVEYFSQPDSALAGLEEAIDYYNNTDTVDGKWFAFITDETGTVLTHSDVDMIGKSLDDVLGPVPVETTREGSWLETESLRVWVVGHQGWIFGSGWRDYTGS